MKQIKSLSFFNLILIIVMTVYSFSSMSSSFFMMGLKAFPWFLISAFFYFIPYALIPYYGEKAILPNFRKRKTLQFKKDCNAF